MAEDRIDFFVSHAGADRAWAEWVAWQLIDAGYTVELDVWDWAAGRNFVTAMSDALDRCDRVLALFSPPYFDRSRYTTEEWSTATLHIPGTGDNRLVAVRIADIPTAGIPAVLRPQVFRDLFGVSEERAKQNLLEAVRGPQRPDRKPVFPAQGTPRGPSRPEQGPSPRLPGSLPQIWNVQQRNPAFVGRDATLLELRKQLLADRTAVAQALHGMGGVGKTQLAVEYAYRFAGTYELVWWITAERTELITAQLADLAVKCGVAVDTAEIPGAVSALHSDLRHRNSWLLIFDNAENPRALQQLIPTGPGHVLITSRTPNWAEVATPVDVKVFAAEESVTLLRRRVPGISIAAAENVAKKLDNYPLALAQAAGVLSETGLPAAIYLKHLADHASQALAEGTPASYSRSLAATVSDAADRLAATDLAAAALLRLSASFSPEPIPTSYFTAAADLSGLSGIVPADPISLHRAFGRISSFGLAQLDQSGVRVHRLVQAIVLDRLSSGQRREDSDRVASLLVAAVPTDTNDPAVWPAWAALLPHLLTADPAESDSTELRQLATKALLYLLRRGDSMTAEALSRTLYERWTERLGPNHPDTLAAATELVYARRERGNLTEARALVEDTLARRQQILGDNHPDTLRSAGDLAVMLNETGNFQAAYELNEETLTRRQQILGDNHPDTLTTANNLASTLGNLVKHQAARELAEDTLTKQRKTLGDNHPDTLTTANNLTDNLNKLGEHQAARELAEDTLTKRRQILGDNHPDTLTTANNLASTLGNLGKHQAARELAEDTLTKRRQILGDNHPDTLITANNLATNLNNLGKHQAARELAEDTLTKQRKTLGDNHHHTLTTALNLGVIRSNAGNLFSARKLLEQTLAGCKVTFGPHHPQTERATQALTGVIFKLGGNPGHSKPKDRRKSKKKHK